jgi:two-component system, chemotaxis family, protein-glutamate methylesterase/glutaminase
MPPIRVLVVDDSASARKVLREALTKAGVEVVGIARDGLEALEKIGALKPDVITLDLSMPNLDGLGVLAALPAADPPRVVVVSNDSALGIAALRAGAVGLVPKSTALALDRLYDISSELVAAIHVAATARPLPAAWKPRKLEAPPWKASRRAIVVIGASTGGPQALTRVINSLPGSFPLPVALVLHLPPGYTRPFAERLDHDSDLEVLEAEPGLELKPGRVVVARAGVHLKLQRTQAGVFCVLDSLPQGSPNRPAVDVLFQSAAQVYGEGVLGVILTGMGDDGTEGARAIQANGGQLITESELSCVVYGMPRCVVEAGLSAASVTIDSMAAEILRRI